ncbi:MAG: hypothetical protein IPO21_14860 [Bacteroidales bacterium]|nr:hypothetical protein [Bacteroidales bacterium]
MENKKTNWFVRILIILLSLFIGFLIFYNFFFTCPSGQINSGLIVLIAFLIVLVLSESFDNFSVAKIITLDRNLQENKQNNQELKKENLDLRKQIFNITTSISNRQVNSPTFVLSDELMKAYKIKEADEPEKIAKKQENDEIPSNQEPARKFISFSRYEEVAMDRFLNQEKLNQLPIIRDAKFVTEFHQIDPISEYSPVFDGYIKTVESEIFIELKPKLNTMMLRERIYIMLSKIHYYRTVNRVNAFLFLVLVSRPDDDKRRFFDKVLTEFEPAIANGLLKIKEIEITEEENEKIIKE